jgi:hypothetical protein
MDILRTDLQILTKRYPTKLNKSQDLRCPGTEGSVELQLCRDISGQPIVPTFKGRTVQVDLDCLTLEDGTDRLSRNVRSTIHPSCVKSLESTDLKCTAEGSQNSCINESPFSFFSICYTQREMAKIIGAFLQLSLGTVAYREGGVQTPPPPRNSEVLTNLSRIPSSVENTSVTT